MKILHKISWNVYDALYHTNVLIKTKCGYKVDNLKNHPKHYSFLIADIHYPDGNIVTEEFERSNGEHVNSVPDFTKNDLVLYLKFNLFTYIKYLYWLKFKK